MAHGSRTRLLLAISLVLASLATPACTPHPEPGRPTAPATPRPKKLTQARLAQLIPSSVADRAGWAADIWAAFDAHDLEKSPESACAVLAVIEQESGFQADPVVPGLAKLVEQQLDEYASKLGPFGPPAVDALLDGKAPGSKLTFAQRLQRVKTERDLDRVFRDLLDYYHNAFPKTYAAADLIGGLFTSKRLEDFNPITTAGSMQVSVRFALDLAHRRGIPEAKVREAIYTRRGGLYYGVARLLGYRADYHLQLYRFADYNAGPYACRNAALQAQVSRLTGQSLVPDGDLLAYRDDGSPSDRDSSTLRAFLAFREKHASDLSEARIRKDLRKEKEIGLEQTDTWHAVKRAYLEVTGQKPTYARLPEVAIVSPKIKGEKTTGWFARSVEARYQKFYRKWQELP